MTEQIVFEQPVAPVKAGQVFYDEDLPKALKQAQEYAGKEGSVATLLDIAQARIIAPKESYVWQKGFTTTSGEYKGLSKKGKPVYVVAHGVGPLTSPERIIEAYKAGLTRGAAKLDPKELYALLDQEDGKKVIVLDFDKVKKLASDVVSVKSARDNPLVRARLGEHTNTYLDKYKEIYGDKIGNWHDCNGIDLDQPQGRLLFAGYGGCDGNLDGYVLVSYGRFVGVSQAQNFSIGNESIVKPSLEQMLKYSAGFVPERLQDEFRKGLKSLFN